LKSTMIDHRLTFLLLDMVLNHFISDICGGDGKLTSCPSMPSSKPFSKVCKVLKQNSLSYALPALHNHAYISCLATANENVDMPAWDSSRNYAQLLLKLIQRKNITSPNRNFARQSLFLVLACKKPRWIFEI
jgi:hypothetical protein